LVDWSGGVLARCSRGSNCTLAHAMDGRICTAAPLVLANQLPLTRLYSAAVLVIDRVSSAI